MGFIHEYLSLLGKASDESNGEILLGTILVMGRIEVSVFNKKGKQDIFLNYYRITFSDCPSN
jgi:hypothetical protein